jgi:Kef-type K+ transport system membrane component KefB
MGWVTAIFVSILLSAYVSQQIGIAPIFGAFALGLSMPPRAELTHDIRRRLDDFIVTVLLPLYFVVTGLRTDVGLLDRPMLWIWMPTLAIIGVASASKWLAAAAAARATVTLYRSRRSSAS